MSSMNIAEKYPNLLRVDRELAQCKHPRKAADMLVSFLKTDADLARSVHEAGEVQA